jgi:ABC-type transport system substrate-binding protein
MGSNGGARHRRSALAARLVAVAVALALVAGAAAGCETLGGGDSRSSAGPGTTGSPRGPAPATGGRLVVAVPDESNGWNPFIIPWDHADALVGSSMIESLAVQDDDGRVQPWLAVRWEPNANFTQWDISVRPGVVFHDGTPLNAAAVKKALDASFQDGVSRLALGPLYDRVAVVDDLTVRVFLKVRWAQYPTSLVYQWALAPSMFDRADGGAANPVGTGPFRFARWTRSESLTARRFDRYWHRDDQDRPLPYLNEIEFRVVSPGDDLAAAVRGGDIDLGLSNDADLATRLDDGHQVLKDYSGSHTYIALNTATGPGNQGNPFTNVHARRALAHATDRRRIAARAGPGVDVTTYGYRPGSRWAPTGNDGYAAYDPEQARREIDLYKRDTGARSLAFTLQALDVAEVPAVMQALEENWAEVGIAARIDNTDAGTLTLHAGMGEYQATWFRYLDNLDPDQTIWYYSSATAHPVGGLSLNITRYGSPGLDADLQTLRESTDPVRRKDANDALIRETNDQALSIWLYDTPELFVAGRQVQGLDVFRTHAFANAQAKPWLAEVWLHRPTGQ